MDSSRGGLLITVRSGHFFQAFLRKTSAATVTLKTPFVRHFLLTRKELFIKFTSPICKNPGFLIRVESLFL